MVVADVAVVDVAVVDVAVVDVAVVDVVVVDVAVVDVVVVDVVVALVGTATRPDLRVDDFFAFVELALTDVEMDFDVVVTVPGAPDEPGMSVRPTSRTSATTMPRAKRVVGRGNT